MMLCEEASEAHSSTGQGWGCQQLYSSCRAMCPTQAQPHSLYLSSLKALCCLNKKSVRAEGRRLQTCRTSLKLDLQTGLRTLELII